MRKRGLAHKATFISADPADAIWLAVQQGHPPLEGEGRRAVQTGDIGNKPETWVTGHNSAGEGLADGMDGDLCCGRTDALCDGG